MSTVVQRTVVVQSGGRIELSARELPEGATAEVTVVVQEPEAPVRKLADMIGTGRGGFASVEEVDEFVRRERDAWHS